MKNFNRSLFYLFLSFCWLVSLISNFLKKEWLICILDAFNFFIWSIGFIQQYQLERKYKKIEKEQTKKRKEQERFNEQFQKIKNIYHEKDF